MALNILAKMIPLLLLPASLLVAGCDKKSSSGQDIDLLTQTPWKYEKAGFDSDQDGVFDALDPRIAGCEKDDTVIFKPDGSGLLTEGPIKCSQMEPSSLPFMWSFQNNDSTLYFQDQYFVVKTLSRQKLEIYSDQNLGGVNTRYIIIFKH
jgi:hypothetical protein